MLFRSLDESKWTPVDSTWTPPVYSDTRAAWTGTLPERPEIPIRIEAAAYRGKPVFFQMIGPMTRPERMQEYKPTGAEQVTQWVLISLGILLLAGSVVLCRRNLRLGRGDRRGAARLATVVFVAGEVEWLLGAHHVPNFYEFALFGISTALAVAVAAFVWVL